MTRTLVPLLCGCVLVPLFFASALAAPPPTHEEATKNAGSVVSTTPTAEPTPGIAHDAERISATLRTAVRTNRGAASAYSGTKPSRKRRKMSAKSRAKIAAAQRRRWAKFRKSAKK